MAAILIVDDDAVICEVLGELFSLEHACRTADTAEKALALLESGHYDVAIVDISLPGMSGLDTEVNGAWCTLWKIGASLKPAAVCSTVNSAPLLTSGVTLV